MSQPPGGGYTPNYDNQPQYPSDPQQQLPYGSPSGSGTPFGTGAPGTGTPPPGYSQYPQLGYGYAAPRPTNMLAIVSLVTSVIGLGLVGIITGHIARGQIRRSGEGGAGLALAGLIVGYVVTALEILFVLAFIGLFAAGWSQGVGMG